MWDGIVLRRLLGWGLHVAEDGTLAGRDRDGVVQEERVVLGLVDAGQDLGDGRAHHLTDDVVVVVLGVEGLLFGEELDAFQARLD